MGIRVNKRHFPMNDMIFLSKTLTFLHVSAPSANRCLTTALLHDGMPALPVRRPPYDCTATVVHMWRRPSRDGYHGRRTINSTRKRQLPDGAKEAGKSEKQKNPAPHKNGNRIEWKEEVVPLGVEPRTHGFSVHCSTTWAKVPYREDVAMQSSFRMRVQR